MELVQRVGDANMLAGVAIKPGTPVDGLLAVMDRCSELKTKSEFFLRKLFFILPSTHNFVLVSLALVMTVEPGFGGQKFMGDMLTKVKAIREKYRSLGKIFTC